MGGSHRAPKLQSLTRCKTPSPWSSPPWHPPKPPFSFGWCRLPQNVVVPRSQCAENSPSAHRHKEPQEASHCCGLCASLIANTHEHYWPTKSPQHTCLRWIHTNTSVSGEGVRPTCSAQTDIRNKTASCPGKGLRTLSWNTWRIFYAISHRTRLCFMRVFSEAGPTSWAFLLSLE